MADKTKFLQVEKLVHPLGWNCLNCFHVVKDPTPGSKQMKCCRHPPEANVSLEQRGVAIMSISPPVKDGEWCGEFEDLKEGIVRRTRVSNH